MFSIFICDDSCTASGIYFFTADEGFSRYAAPGRHLNRFRQTVSPEDLSNENMPKRGECCYCKSMASFTRKESISVWIEICQQDIRNKKGRASCMLMHEHMCTELIIINNILRVINRRRKKLDNTRGDGDDSRTTWKAPVQIESLRWHRLSLMKLSDGIMFATATITSNRRPFSFCSSFAFALPLPIGMHYRYAQKSNFTLNVKR